MCKQYASRLIDADAKHSRLGSARMNGVAHPHAGVLVAALADGNSMCALAASVSLHNAAHFRVGEFLNVE